MIEWLVPVCVFWTLSALYLGGFPLRIEGGTGGRQFIGLLLTLVLYLAVWWVVRMALGSALSTIPLVIVATAVAVLAIPFIARLAFRMMGVRITMPTHAHG